LKFELDFEQEGAPNRLETVWVKTGLEPHSKSIGTDVVYAGETFYYRNIAGKYETRTPNCYLADSDAMGNSVLILDDLGKYGARFIEPTTAGSPELVGRGLEAIARYQAASWMSSELYEMDLLRSGGVFTTSDCLAWIYDRDHWADYSTRPRFQALDPRLRDRELLLRAHSVLRNEWLRREPWALSHGDAHFGQTYTLPSGEARLIDWQCVQIANYAQDIAYFMVGGLTVEDRRQCGRDLITHYVAKLREFGVEDAPSADEAYALVAAYLVHGIGWAMCMVEMQPEENCVAMTERYSSAMVEMRSLEVLLGSTP
jgi:hypothetical protein